MLDLDLIRSNSDLVRQALKRLGDDTMLEPILDLDTRRREAVHEGDNLREQRNDVSQRIGHLLNESKRTRDEDQAKELSIRVEDMKEAMRTVGEQIKDLESQVRELDAHLSSILLTLPNIPLPNVPDGPDETANIVVRTEGEPASFDFSPIAHWDLAERLGIIDFERGAKLSGSRFYLLCGAGARLQRSLISWMLDLHSNEHGYTEIYPPAVVLQEVMQGSGNLPKFNENLYHDEEDDLWLIPSAEVPLTGLHRNEVLEPGALPKNYVSCTPCFRREKAAAGRDTRGIKRVHQFDKVELYKLVEPERSEEELLTLLGNAEEVIRGLGIPYRVVQLCTGDLGFQSAMSYDLEMWAPGCMEWLEVSSCSNCTDFQARRSNIRFRREHGGKLDLPHTLNGSGLAIPRVMIAILETFQRSDGSVVIPEVLRPYTGFEVINSE